MSPQFNNFDVDLLNGSLSEEQLQSYLSTYFYIENIEKPLKAFSSYKLDDLIKIAEQLKITIYDENGKKRKKQDYYEKIAQKVA
jgi:pyrroloquinoline quinone (PQQ) biosynthesis protein C